jgi:hypothetical protein
LVSFSEKEVQFNAAEFTNIEKVTFLNEEKIDNDQEEEKIVDDNGKTLSPRRHHCSKFECHLEFEGLSFFEYPEYHAVQLNESMTVDELIALDRGGYSLSVPPIKDNLKKAAKLILSATNRIDKLQKQTSVIEVGSLVVARIGDGTTGKKGAVRFIGKTEVSETLHSFFPIS